MTRGRLAATNGAASLIAILLLAALLLGLGAVGTRSSQVELRIASNDLLSRRALELADAGAQHAWALLRDPGVGGLTGSSNGFDDELASNGTGGTLTSIGSVVNLSGSSWRYRAFGGDFAGDGYYVRIVDDHDETAAVNDPALDRNNRIRIVSHGRVRGAERVVEAIVERDPPVGCVLCAAVAGPLPADVTLVGSALTDSFDSRVAPYASGSAGNNGNVHSNGDVLLSNVLLLPMTIKGSVRASGTITKVMLPLVNTIDVTGVQTQGAPPVVYPPVRPCGPPFPANQGLAGGLYTRATGVLVSTGVGQTITLAPGDYCFSQITMAHVGSTLLVTGPTRIFLAGPLPSVIAGALNTTGVPSNLRVFSSVATSLLGIPLPGLTIDGITQTSLVVYAPQAMVELGSVVSELSGAVVGAFLPAVSVGGRFHYDEALADPPPRLVDWREARAGAVD